MGSDFFRDVSRPPAGATLSGPPGSAVPQYEGWDPAGDGGPDCPFCGVEMRSAECSNEDCPGEVLQCEVIVFHGSRNPDAHNFGPDETCENDAIPGQTVCTLHSYEIDEPPFVHHSGATVAPVRPSTMDPWVEPDLRVRSDGRLEVVGEQAAAERYGCLVDPTGECVLINEHEGPCTPVREDWVGPDALVDVDEQDR